MIHQFLEFKIYSFEKLEFLFYSSFASCLHKNAYSHDPKSPKYENPKKSYIKLHLPYFQLQ